MTARARRISDQSGRDGPSALANRTGSIVGGGITVPASGDATLDIDGRAVALTHLDRVLYPATGFTKADLVAYWLDVAHAALPHLEGRAITVGRFPAGVEGRAFAQTEIPGRPSWIRTVPIALRSGEVKRFTIVEDRATLVFLAQVAALELHTFLAPASALESPSHILFDLDPTPPAYLLDAAEVALLLDRALTSRGVPPSVKTSGSSGLHVLVPAAEGSSYAHTRELAAEIAREVAAERPELVTMALPRAERAGKVLVDVRQNSSRLTVVVPYSPRSTPRPRISTPVTWDEIRRAVLDGQTSQLEFDADDVRRRVRAIGIPVSG
jgi:bifunctional non-homologous end joining protein LigD